MRGGRKKERKEGRKERKEKEGRSGRQEKQDLPFPTSLAGLPVILHPSHFLPSRPPNPLSTFSASSLVPNVTKHICPSTLSPFGPVTRLYVSLIPSGSGAAAAEEEDEDEGAGNNDRIKAETSAGVVERGK